MKKPFMPQNMKDIKLDWVGLVPLISKSNAILSNYNGALRHLVNPQILLMPMTTREAELSSKIEGTQATLAEVFRYEAGDEGYSETKIQDINEIINYRKSLLFAVGVLKDKPIHLNLLKTMHAMLLDGVRGENKSRGKFRNIQNWIGTPAKKSMEDATYVPPSPDKVLSALDDWEKFVNSDYLDPLVQAGLIHAQFEIIHPFLDGNGRLGRILIPLFLYQKHYLVEPSFYLSEYFEANRDDYYNRLNNISENGDWQGWMEFFLTAIVEQSNLNIIKIQEIMSLYDIMKKKIQKSTKSSYAQVILDVLFKNPIFTSTRFSKSTKMNKITANNILRKLVENDVLKLLEAGSGSRASMYAFADLINLTEGKVVI